MTALTSPPPPLPTHHDASQELTREPSQAVTGAPAPRAQSRHRPYTPPEPAVPTPDSVTIGQAAALTGLHKNTIRAYIKQGRLAARVMRGKYGQEYRIGRAELVALAALVNPQIDGAGDGAAAALHDGLPAAGGVVTAGEPPPSQGSGEDSRAEDSLGMPGTASPHALSLEPLVGLVSKLQEENRNLAGQLGFVQAQLQQARETIRLLQAPPPDAADGGQGVEVEAAAEDLEHEREAAAAEGRRPWWRFW